MQEENIDILRDFAFRLDRAADHAGLSQVEIAARLGIKTPRVNNWFKAKNFPRSNERPKLAATLGVLPAWLFAGEGVPQKNSVVEANSEPYGGTFVRQVPVISWTHAGEAATYEEMPKHWHGTVATTSRDKRAFALTIEGDSMEPKFFAGDCVILEPSSEPHNGKPVVARFVTDDVQLRIFHKMANGKIRLSSLRPEIYSTEEHTRSAFHWIFPVVGLYRPI